MELNKEIQKIRERINNYYSGLEDIEKRLTIVEDKKANIELMKLWKLRLGKYFRVKYFGHDVKDKCEYTFVGKLGKNNMVMLHAYSDMKYKYTHYYDFIPDDYCEKWEEITEDEFNTITKNYELSEDYPTKHNILNGKQ